MDSPSLARWHGEVSLECEGILHPWIKPDRTSVLRVIGLAFLSAVPRVHETGSLLLRSLAEG